MPRHRPQTITKQARARIERIRQQLVGIDYLCSGTLSERMKLCGRASCACARDPAARHGPYYEWGFMRASRLVHRQVSATQAAALRQAITNYRKVKQLLRDWEIETERLIDAEQTSDD
jgi:hypothetical protein